jgi:hypothetical protein
MKFTYFEHSRFGILLPLLVLAIDSYTWFRLFNGSFLEILGFAARRTRQQNINSDFVAGLHISRAATWHTLTVPDSHMGSIDLRLHFGDDGIS